MSSDIETERQIRDKEKTITAYQTHANAVKALGSEEPVGEGSKKGGMSKLIESFETMMGASKEERETYYGDRIRDYAAGRIASDSKTTETEVAKPDYAVFMVDMEQELRDAGIDQTILGNVITALKQKYKVQ